MDNPAVVVAVMVSSAFVSLLVNLVMARRPFVNPIVWLEQRVGTVWALTLYLGASVLLVGGLLALSVAIQVQ